MNHIELTTASESTLSGIRSSLGTPSLTGVIDHLSTNSITLSSLKTKTSSATFGNYYDITNWWSSPAGTYNGVSISDSKICQDVGKSDGSISSQAQHYIEYNANYGLTLTPSESIEYGFITDGLLSRYISVDRNSLVMEVGKDFAVEVTDQLTVKGSLCALEPVHYTETGAPPSDPVTPANWIDVYVNGTLYKMPLYQ